MHITRKNCMLAARPRGIRLLGNLAARCLLISFGEQLRTAKAADFESRSGIGCYKSPCCNRCFLCRFCQERRRHNFLRNQHHSRHRFSNHHGMCLFEGYMTCLWLPLLLLEGEESCLLCCHKEREG